MMKQLGNVSMTVTKLGQHETGQDVDAFVLAMYLMFSRAPKNPNPDFDNYFDLGEIGLRQTEESGRAFRRVQPRSLASLCLEVFRVYMESREHDCSIVRRTINNPPTVGPSF